MIIINETVRADLIVFIALFADLATIAVAYDNAHYEQRPVEWQLPKIWVISVVLVSYSPPVPGSSVAACSCPTVVIIENFGNPQEILFLEIALTENWLIFVTRGGKTLPSWQLVGAIFGVDVLATLFCVFGWISGGEFQQTSPPDSAVFTDGNTSIVTVVIVWAYSLGVTIIIAMTYKILTDIPWLDNLGRVTRSKTDTQIENIIGHLSKLAMEHEHEDGKDRWFLTTRALEEQDDE